MQIYKHMNIGTAKPTISELAALPHHMIDIVNPDEQFDAGRFAKMAGDIIIRLKNNKKVPFVVGGTGLYIKALLHGLFRTGPADPDLIAHLKQEALKHGSGYLHKKLREIDIQAAEKIHPNDTFRIARAIEVFKVTGKTISEYHKKHMFTGEFYQAIKIGLYMDKDLIYDRINKRIDMMIDQGLFDEVKGLLKMGYGENLKSMRSIGYRHMVDFINKRFSWEETIRIFKRDTRRYAKRQLTWFRSDPQIKWAEPGQLNKIQILISDFLSNNACT